MKIKLILSVFIIIVNSIMCYSQLTYHGIELTNFNKQDGFEECTDLDAYCKYNVGIFKKAIIWKNTKMIAFLADKDTSENDVYQEVRNLCGKEPDEVHSLAIIWRLDVINVNIIFLDHTTQVAIIPK